MRKTLTTLVLFVAALTLAVPAVWADVPTNMNVQGKLTDPAGAPVAPGAWQFTFRIFDMEAGGTQIWPTNGVNGEEQIIVMGDDGLWTTNVGEDTALTEVVFLDTTRWLEVTVTNFIDPAEVMPRMKLNTNPFTFRSASSQNSDLLDGLNSSDFAASAHGHSGLWSVNGVDYYYNGGNVGVGTNTPGATLDVLGGSIRNLSFNEDNGADEGNLVINNSNSGVIGPPWNKVNGAWGAMIHVEGDSPLYNIGLGVSAFGDVSDEQAGINALVRGGPSTSTQYAGRFTAVGAGAGNAYGVHSFVSSTGANKFSGFFTGGDFVIQNSQSLGTDAVILPTDAISDFEIEDEPGLSNSATTNFFFAGAASIVPYVVDSVEINCPTDGYVVVSGQLGWVNITHTSGSNTEFWCKIDKNSGNTGLPVGSTVFRHQSTHPSTGVLAVPMQASRVYSESAGAHKYYLIFDYSVGSDVSPQIGSPNIRAIFYPTLYGTTTLTESSEGGQDAAAEEVVATDGSGPLPAMSSQTITLDDHNAIIEAELAELRARLKALEDEASSALTTSHVEER